MFGRGTGASHWCQVSAWRYIDSQCFAPDPWGRPRPGEGHQFCWGPADINIYLCFAGLLLVLFKVPASSAHCGWGKGNAICVPSLYFFGDSLLQVWGVFAGVLDEHATAGISCCLPQWISQLRTGALAALPPPFFPVFFLLFYMCVGPPFQFVGNKRHNKVYLSHQLLLFFFNNGFDTFCIYSNLVVGIRGWSRMASQVRKHFHH